MPGCHVVQRDAWAVIGQIDPAAATEELRDARAKGVVAR